MRAGSIGKPIGSRIRRDPTAVNTGSVPDFGQPETAVSSVVGLMLRRSNLDRHVSPLERGTIDPDPS